MPLPPPLSSEDRARALAKAADSRRERAELKEKLKMGSITLDELLDQSERDDVIARTKVLTVLESLPGLGKVKARRLMEQLNISLARRIQGLGAKQREALIKEFGQR
ncbi:MAG TPA: integration host factor, actinobacterial type [Acidimicrobiales bacterium]|nr:integration host factor, actinobacterial type [Acidimicrobiales bacterium]